MKNNQLRVWLVSIPYDDTYDIGQTVHHVCATPETARRMAEQLATDFNERKRIMEVHDEQYIDDDHINQIVIYPVPLLTD